MSDHAIVNLLALDDFMVGRIEGLEGRFAREALGSRDIGVSHWRYAPGLRLDAHAHPEEEEAYVILAGSGRVLLDGEVRELKQWDALRVAPDVAHAFEAGPDGLEMIAIGGPRPGGAVPSEGDTYWPDVAWPD